jgi:hypothetical protein
MRQGYLTIETNLAHPGMVRLRGLDSIPTEFPPHLKYVARFSDLDAALMHFHTGLRRRLVDVDKRIYRASETEAVAVSEAIELSQRRIYLDPELTQDPNLPCTVERLHRTHRFQTGLFDLIGILALLALLAATVVGI